MTLAEEMKDEIPEHDEPEKTVETVSEPKTVKDRIHIDVSGSTRPFEKYSAMPSTSHSGSCSRLKRRRCCVADAARQ